LGAPRRHGARTGGEPAQSSPFRSVSDPIGSDPPIPAADSCHRATVTSRHKQTNRPGGRCVSRAICVSFARRTTGFGSELEGEENQRDGGLAADSEFSKNALGKKKILRHINLWYMHRVLNVDKIKN